MKYRSVPNERGLQDYISEAKKDNPCGPALRRLRAGIRKEKIFLEKAIKVRQKWEESFK